MQAYDTKRIYFEKSFSCDHGSAASIIPNKAKIDRPSGIEFCQAELASAQLMFRMNVNDR